MNEQELNSELEKIGRDEQLCSWMLQRIASYGSRAACLPLARFADAVLHEDWTESEKKHIGECKSCQRARSQVYDELWHPTMAVLYRFRHGNLSAEELANVATHLEQHECRRCKGLLRVLSADLVVTRLWERLERGATEALATFDTVLHNLTASRGPCEQLAPAPAFTAATEAESLPFRELAFDDGDTLGTVYLKKTEATGHVDRCLAIESKRIEPGTLVWVGIASDQQKEPSGTVDSEEGMLPSTAPDMRAPAEAVARLGAASGGGTSHLAWSGYVMIRPGYERSEAKTQISVLPPGPCFPYKRDVQIETLPYEDPELLQKSFVAAEISDPVSRPHWQRWADKALQSLNRDSLSPAMAEVLQRIAGSASMG